MWKDSKQEKLVPSGSIPDLTVGSGDSEKSDMVRLHLLFNIYKNFLFWCLAFDPS